MRMLNILKRPIHLPIKVFSKTQCRQKNQHQEYGPGSCFVVILERKRHIVILLRSEAQDRTADWMRICYATIEDRGLVQVQDP